jgi:hypothetical protein
MPFQMISNCAMFAGYTYSAPATAIKQIAEKTPH